MRSESAPKPDGDGRGVAGLIVESDDATLGVATRAMQGAGFTALPARSAAEAARLADGGDHLGFVVIDVFLPDADGVDLCRRLRASLEAPIIMLATSADLDRAIFGVDLGADDFLVKPFDSRRLLARMQLVARRRGNAGIDVLRSGDLLVDPLRMRVSERGRDLDLTMTDLRLLIELMSAPARVRSRRELLDAVWGCDYLGESRLVDMAVKRLRAKLRDNARRPRYIETVRGQGYVFTRRP